MTKKELEEAIRVGKLDDEVYVLDCKGNKYDIIFIGHREGPATAIIIKPNTD